MDKKSIIFHIWNSCILLKIHWQLRLQTRFSTHRNQTLVFIHLIWFSTVFTGPTQWLLLSIASWWPSTVFCCHHQPFLDPLFLLHSPVLKPYLYLSFVQLKSWSDFYASCSCQVLVEVKLLFKFGQLLVSEVSTSRIV